MTQIALDVRNLSRDYGSHRAVDDVSFQIKAGEVFGFLGHNGAGKTTLIHMLTTLRKPTSGNASIFGKDIETQSSDVRKLIGYVPENVRLYDALTTRENLRYLAGLSGVERPDEAVDACLEYLCITDLANKPVGAFSKGMRQRVGLAQGIIHNPKLLFLDEPASGLDPLGMRQLRELVTRLNTERGMTIFMNTHLISEVAQTCSSIGVLSLGKLVFNGPVAEVNHRFGHPGAMEELYMNVQSLKGAGAA